MTTPSPFRAQVTAVVSATRIIGDRGFSWFGKRPPRLPGALLRSLAGDVRRAYLTQALSEHLYGYFYVKGYASPMHWEAPPGQERLGALTADLRRANAGQGRWEPGWRLVDGEADDASPEAAPSGAASMAVLVARDRLAFSVLAPRLVTSTGGGGAALWNPPELPHRSPGHYLAVSDAPLDAGRPLVRIYWNVGPRAAVVLMAELTGSLRQAGLGYQLKAVDDPRGYDRCDPVVLYLASDDYDAAVPALTTARARIGSRVRARGPALTLQVAPGVGLAEDTDNGGSYGMHRCRLLAEALIDAAGEPGGLDTRVHVVMQRLAARDVDPEQPYLRPATSFRYRTLGPDVPTRRRSVPALASVPTPAHGADDPRESAHLVLAAGTLADRLVNEATWAGPRCTWTGSVVPAGDDRVLTTLDPTLYGGLAGVALFLAHMHATIPQDAYRTTALGALAQADALAAEVRPERRRGLFDGWVGIALAMARCGHLLGIDHLIDRARALSAALPAPGSGERDVISGSAGAILGLIELAALIDEPAALDLARGHGDVLLEAAHPVVSGLSWSTTNRKREFHLTGLSHGTAGIAHALLELAAATGDERYARAAEAGYAYERGWFDARAGNWPDLRETQAVRRQVSTGELAFSTYWCHGAPGISLTRLRAWQLTGRAEYRAEAVTALETTRQYTQAALDSSTGNWSLCHGLLGNAVVLSVGARVLGVAGDELARAARAVSAEGIRRHGTSGDWTLATPEDSPGLMLGTAGIGYGLLALDDPRLPVVLALRVDPATTATAATTATTATPV